ncbi:hypothetical protein [Methanobacterium sp. BAmetb5]|nr:hypothetical protein [Methanobacterium sp. BAmetb5]
MRSIDIQLILWEGKLLITEVVVQHPLLDGDFWYRELMTIYIGN